MGTRLPSLLLLTFGVACTASPEAPSPPPAHEHEHETPATGPTYHADVKAILDARCVGCHQTGGAAPFSLAAAEEVLPLAGTLLDAIETRRMPPWPAGDGCNTYAHDPSLSDAEIALVAAWVEAGAHAGPPAADPAPVPPLPSLSRVDVSLSMGSAHVPMPPSGGIDEHRCFLVEWPYTEPMYMTGYQAFPGNPKVVHHFVGNVVPPDRVADFDALDAADPGEGWACGAGGGMGGTGQLFAAWVPGSGAVELPEGTGLLIEPGSKLLLNMHYNTLSGDTGADQTRLDFRVERQVDRPGRSVFIANPRWIVGRTMDIPAGDSDVEHRFSFDPTRVTRGPVTIHLVGLHMHTLAVSGGLRLKRAGGDTCLVDIRAWDFNWQMGYRLETPVEVRPGDELEIYCRYDNSPANQPIIDGQRQAPRDVNWGEDTFDEMCLGTIYYTE